jgi:NAD(P)-dependent dehydrogenase (short-subunit alcohol dehydrogenase family)
MDECDGITAIAHEGPDPGFSLVGCRSARKSVAAAKGYGDHVRLLSASALPEGESQRDRKTDERRSDMSDVFNLDVLVNNARTAIPKLFEETPMQEIDQRFSINVRGRITIQAAIKHMKSGGRIIMIGSCVGERLLTPGLAASSATKGAIKMCKQGLSTEVAARGITVNKVQPGPLDTDLNPHRATGPRRKKRQPLLIAV